MGWDEDRWTAKLVFLFILKMSLNNDNGRGGYPTKSDMRAATREQEALQQSPQPNADTQAQPQPSQPPHQQQQQQSPTSSSPPSPPQQQPRPAANTSTQPQQQRPPLQQQQQAARAPGQQQRPPGSQQQRPGGPSPQGSAAPRPRPPGTAPQLTPQQRQQRMQQQQLRQKQAAEAERKRKRNRLVLALGLSGGGLVVGSLVTWGIVSLVRRRRRAASEAAAMAASGIVLGPCSKVKPTKTCVPLADGSACVVRREIPADNSCLFNAIGYVMHGSKTKASFLRSVVAREVSSDPNEYNEAFLGMSNAAYCSWIMQPINWGGGIELAILSRHYGQEIAAWNIESKKPSVFGEDQGYPRQVMVIYTGSHYDALAIAKNPKAPEKEDKTHFNPRTKAGKMTVAAAQKLTELAHRGSKYYTPPVALKCQSCPTVCKGKAEIEAHVKKTGHKGFSQIH